LPTSHTEYSVTWPIAVLHVNDAISDDMVDNIHTCAALINPKANFESTVSCPGWSYVDASPQSTSSKWWGRSRFSNKKERL